MSRGIQARFAKRFEAGGEIRVESWLTSEQGGITVLFGPSGAGKTTVLRCLAGLLRPDEGEIHFGEQVWSNAATKVFLPSRKRRIGFVPQDYALFPHLTVARNIAYGLNDLNRSERTQRVAEMIDWLELKGLEQRLPGELSGGQQQRVALGRAVAGRPALLLLDEPLAALDAPTRVRLRGELRHLLRAVNAPSVIVTHDRSDALALGDELLVMDRGRTVQQGKPADVFNRPANLAVAAIVGMETVQPGRVLKSGELMTIAVGNKELMALGSELPAMAKEVFVCIRAEDVILIKGELPRSSPRNCLPAVVQELIAEGPLIRVTMDCGFALMALLTKQACEELTLRKGDAVLALVKAPNVHLLARAR